jgi:restriction system-associated AAA family ATPase
MKLLKLAIGDLPAEKQFRSLHPGFSVEFHRLDTKGIKAMESFSPFCFAGLNGSGKSNVLEALAAIFYHLECCVAKFKPNTFKKHFRPDECNPDAFTLEYLIGQHNSKPYALAYFDKIIISKKAGEAPAMTRQAFPFSEKEELIPVSLAPRYDTVFPQAAEGKAYLPQIIVGYSSGENEILSLPFRKSRLINFDKYVEDQIKNYQFEEPENSLIYIDNEMSQAVLLACLLYEDEEALKPLRKELSIVGLQSFRLVINNLTYGDTIDTNRNLVNHIAEKIAALEKIATCAAVFDIDKNLKIPDINGGYKSIVFDFFVDEDIKKAFRAHFSSSFELFRFFQVLYELNAYEVSDGIKEEVYTSNGFYTDWKIPKSSPRDFVFVFEDYYILKKIEGDEAPRPLLLREFSDGEHQFLHTMGICLMLKDRKSILLLDEPETHFNPSWRAKFIKILDDSIRAGNNHPNSSYNVHYLKDILLTSHSPFIISDCMPNNVIFFDRNADTKKIQARKAAALGFNTYGTSVEIILDELFNYNQSIGDLSNEVLQKIDFATIKTREDAINAKKLFSHLGESIEKDLVLARLNQVIKDDPESDGSLIPLTGLPGVPGGADIFLLTDENEEEDIVEKIEEREIEEEGRYEYEV